MSNEEIRTVRVAAVQMESKNSLIEENLDHATPLIDLAAQDGAKLILLPEFMPTGYIWTKAIWDGAEPKEGPTVKWLKENSKRMGIWLGTSYLEANGEDFFDTFVLVTPEGEEAGRVRKQMLLPYEAYFFKREAGPHVIDTELGKIGVAIQYENYHSYILQIMHQQSVDLLLMPFSVANLMESLIHNRKFLEYFNNRLGELACYYACLLGVPVVMANKCGRWQSPVPVFGLPFLWKEDSTYAGLSTIVDSDGTVKAQLGEEEAVIVEDVTLDSSRKIHEPPKCYGRWAQEYGWWKITVGKNAWRVQEPFVRLFYTLSSERKKRARSISIQESGGL